MINLQYFITHIDADSLTRNSNLCCNHIHIHTFQLINMYCGVLIVRRVGILRYLLADVLQKMQVILDR